MSNPCFFCCCCCCCRLFKPSLSKWLELALAAFGLLLALAVCESVRQSTSRVQIASRSNYGRVPRVKGCGEDVSHNVATICKWHERDILLTMRLPCIRRNVIYQYLLITCVNLSLFSIVAVLPIGTRISSWKWLVDESIMDSYYFLFFFIINLKRNEQKIANTVATSSCSKMHADVMQK